jgi:hypothetical protein
VLKRFADRGVINEPPEGAEVPADWPILTVGQELRQIKGWRAIVVGIDTEEQTIVVKFERR